MAGEESWTEMKEKGKKGAERGGGGTEEEEESGIKMKE